MNISIRELLKDKHVEASAPCRIDMGGTLDLSTFYLPLRRYRPCTFNIALDMRTTVTVKPCKKGITRIKSRGFEPTTFRVKKESRGLNPEGSNLQLFHCLRRLLITRWV